MLGDCGRAHRALAVVRLALEHRRKVRLHMVTRQVACAPRESVVAEEVTECATHPHVGVDGGEADVPGAKVNLPVIEQHQQGIGVGL